MAQILAIFLVISLSFADFVVKSFIELKYKDVIKQKYEESCGASAMATLLNLDGNKFSEKDILKNINTTDAISLYTLSLIAKKHNYLSKSYKINLKILKTIKYPIIARIARDKNYPHFVVIKVFKDFVLVLDPNYGKYALSFDEFNKIWTKYIFIVKLKHPKKIEYNLSEFSYIKDLY